MAKIIVEREFGYFGLMRRIVIKVDGKRCAKIGLNGRAEFTIDPGIRVVQAQMDWEKSMPIKVAIEEDDAVGFTCRASGQISLHKVFHAKAQEAIRSGASEPADGTRKPSAGARSRAKAASSGQSQHESADRHEQREVPIDDRPAPWNVVLGVRIDAP